MVRRHGLRSLVYPGLGVLAWTFGIFGTALASIVKTDVAKIPQDLPSIRNLLLGLQGDAWYMVPLLGLLTAVTVFIRRQIGEPWVWGAIHHLVNSYRDFVFSEEKQENLHHHRVTLFRHYAWWKYPCAMKRPWGDRLMVVARSGHTTQKTDAAFLVPDDANNAEGFAGQAWTRFSFVIVSDLPDVEANQTSAVIAEYAKQSFCSVAWVRNRLASGRTMARSFCGIAVRVKGREWGVIVIDSKSPQAVMRTDAETYELMGRSLGKLLERV